eukprot:GHVU01029506.1.p1 GENE.GHVU01029506.1~~GHVU01029506.1.p1  ORF type:complete len:289 (-),score=32.87 GHVU01029506.1:448-1314(-)
MSSDHLPLVGDRPCKVHTKELRGCSVGGAAEKQDDKVGRGTDEQKREELNELISEPGHGGGAGGMGGPSEGDERRPSPAVVSPAASHHIDENKTDSANESGTDQGDDMDVGLWPVPISAEMRERLLSNGTVTHLVRQLIHSLQHGDSKDGNSVNGEGSETAVAGGIGSTLLWSKAGVKGKGRSRRAWLCHSTATNSLFCLPCKFLSASGHPLGTTGIEYQGEANRRRAESALDEHEDDKAHAAAVRELVNLIIRRSSIVGSLRQNPGIRAWCPWQSWLDKWLGPVRLD